MNRDSPGIELSVLLARLMLDAADGVRESLRLQEERFADMITASSQEPYEFAQHNVTEEQIDAELAQLFPTRRKGHIHGIFEGAPYRPAVGEEPEVPPIAEVLDVQLDSSAYRATHRPKMFVLGPLGVEKVRTVVRQRLGSVSQDALQRVVSRGIPHVMVDSGTISVALALTIETPTEPQRSPRIFAKTIDDRSPQNQQLRVDILSRLEVRFKTTS